MTISTTHVAFPFFSRFLSFCSLFLYLSIIWREFVHLLRSFHRLHLSVNSFMDSCSFLQHSQGCFTWFLEKFSTKFWISAFFDDLISDGLIHAWKFTGYSLLAQTAHKLIDSSPLYLLHLAENMSLKWNINFRCKIVIQDCNAVALNEVSWSSDTRM